MKYIKNILRSIKICNYNGNTVKFAVNYQNNLCTVHLNTVIKIRIPICRIKYVFEQIEYFASALN